jgi:glycyl-tRNA synthetase
MTDFCCSRKRALKTVFAQATGVKLCAESKLSEPKVVDIVEMIPNKGALGKAFKTDAKQITEALAALSIDEV